MTFFKKVFALIVSFSAYPSLGLQPVRRVLIFLLKVAAFAALLLVVGLVPRFLFHAKGAAEWLGQNLPDSAIVDGKYTTDAELPVRLTHRFFSIHIVASTGAELEEGPDLERPIAFVFEPERLRMLLFTQEPDLEVVERAFPFELVPDGTINTEYLQELFRKMIWQSLPLEFLVIWLSAFAFAVGLALFLTLINRILVRITQRPDLPLVPMFNLCCLAQTPALMLTSSYIIMGMWRWQMQGIYFIIYTVYWIGGSIAFRRQVPWIAMGPLAQALPTRERAGDANGANGAEDDDADDEYADEEDTGEEADPDIQRDEADANEHDSELPSRQDDDADDEERTGDENRRA